MVGPQATPTPTSATAVYYLRSDPVREFDPVRESVSDFATRHKRVNAGVRKCLHVANAHDEFEKVVIEHIGFVQKQRCILVV